MIVDDRVAIIGSANINDRSMVCPRRPPQIVTVWDAAQLWGGGRGGHTQRGTRDSEIGVLLEPEEADLIPSTMGGKPVLVGKFAHSLRTRLWAEYLGVLPPSPPTHAPCDPTMNLLTWRH
jgi:phospholipase D1/2